jgi:hypothetical protein
VAVGVIEEFTGGAGDTTRASTWVAAFVASQALDKRLSDHEFTVRVGGYVDGPSASLLIGATMIALMRGDTPRADTTMTGLLLPSGSSGPVGGIVQKMRGAKQAGIKRFGYPAGSRIHMDPATGKQVDLHQVGAELGLEVREIKDIDEAYTWMTGKTLPQEPAASERDMALDGPLQKRLEQRNNTLYEITLKYLQTVKKERDAAPKLAASMQPTFELLLKQIEQGQQFDRTNQPEAAYARIITALVLSSTIMRQLRLLTAFAASDQGAISQQLTALRGARSILKPLLSASAARAKQQTLGGHINATYGLMLLVQSNAFFNAGDALLDAGDAIADKILRGERVRDQATLQQLLAVLVLPALYMAAGEACALAGEQQLALSAEEGDKRANPDAIGHIARAYRSAAQANLAYFDALILKEQAALHGITEEETARRFTAAEVGYMLARHAATSSHLDMDSQPEALQELFSLAAAASSYITTSELIFKYYSLRAQLTADGSVQLGRREPLDAQIELARLRALRSAGRAKKRLGFIPTASRLDYSLALSLRTGDDQDRVQALSSLWYAAFWSELALSLSR